MNLLPLANAHLAVQIHVATVVPAFFIGTWLIVFSRKGARLHRAFGYFYLALMAMTSVAALFVHQINPQGILGLSPIHVFVPLTLAGIIEALYAACTHQIRRHRIAMLMTYVGALLIAGAFAFMPGRIMHSVLVG